MRLIIITKQRERQKKPEEMEMGDFMPLCLDIPVNLPLVKTKGSWQKAVGGRLVERPQS